jgi:hypothetical protein
MTQDYIPFPEIVSELRRLCSAKATGTMFIATMANSSAQVMLDKGEIVFVYFFNKRGEEALELMSTILAGRYRFQEGAVTRRTPLPSTDAILQSFLSGQKIAGQKIAGQKIVSKVSEPRPAGPGLSQEQKDVLETCLAGYIGPMAGILCEDHLSDATDLKTAVDALVAEIPSAEQAEKFRATVMGKLG